MILNDISRFHPKLYLVRAVLIGAAALLTLDHTVM